ncbi:lytic transglycosylase domain-containing protein [Falsihalocynthiibacter sp. SS001]|uniref:lytic transglycosylase domain-containing protein n=1 Tax=Falsihalocynthiibacter sp. SS001 TaxID=3349698 RepID=UPI0036D358B4
MLNLLRISCSAVLATYLSCAPLAAQTGDAIAKAMDHVRAQDWREAFNVAKPAGNLAYTLVDWHYLRAGRGEFREYENFLKTNGDWPGLPYLRKRGEEAIEPGIAAERILAFFESDAPQTGKGALAYAAALSQSGQSERALKVVADAWQNLSLTASDQQAFLANYSSTIKPLHTKRLDMLLWRGYSGEAQAMFPLVSDGWKKLAAARIGLRKQVNGVDGMIASVPNDLANDPGLAYERFVWRARKGRDSDALELLKERSTSVAALGEPHEWSRRRASLARSEMREGRYQSAYDAASSHHLTSGSDFADLEWLSGYIALRFLNRPSDALKHFDAFQGAVDTPISLGRAGYWRGRAYEAMADYVNAEAAYISGGEHQTSFYGQLAAEKAGIPMDPLLLGQEQFPSWKTASFVNSSVFEAGRLLDEAREGRLSARFFAHLAESLNRQERGALAAWALSENNPYVALHIAKRSVEYGDTIHGAYYPMHPVGTMSNLTVAPELALAIARRESEFNPRVVSSAGAQGLMQVMPGTAKLVSGKIGVAYKPSSLTSDWKYNALLGTNYLVGLNKEFGSNVILVSAGYNAGPGRPRRWIKERGDPRSTPESVVDWIEHIPFNETRNYTMRVSEALLPYRAQISGKPQILRLSSDLTQR